MPIAFLRVYISQLKVKKTFSFKSWTPNHNSYCEMNKKKIKNHKKNLIIPINTVYYWMCTFLTYYWIKCCIFSYQFWLHTTMWCTWHCIIYFWFILWIISFELDCCCSLYDIEGWIAWPNWFEILVRRFSVTYFSILICISLKISWL